MDNNIFITGGTGFVGLHVREHLLQRKNGPNKLHVISRQTLEADERTRFYHGDLKKANDLATFLSNPGTLIHLAYAPNDESGTAEKVARALIQTAKERGITRIIHCSTAVVVGRQDANMINEDSPCFPYSEYEKVKLRLESIFLNETPSNIDVFIIRPTAVFGPGGKNLVKLVQDRIQNDAFKNYLTDCLYGDRTLNLVSVNRVAAAIAHFATVHIPPIAERPTREVVILSSDEDPDNNYKYLALQICRHFNTRKLTVPTISFLQLVLPFALRLAGRSGVNPKRRYLSNKITSWGFQDESTFKQELSNYLNWLKISQTVRDL